MALLGVPLPAWLTVPPPRTNRHGETHTKDNAQSASLSQNCLTGTRIVTLTPGRPPRGRVMGTSAKRRPYRLHHARARINPAGATPAQAPTRGALVTRQRSRARQWRRKGTWNTRLPTSFADATDAAGLSGVTPHTCSAPSRASSSIRGVDALSYTSGNDAAPHRLRAAVSCRHARSHWDPRPRAGVEGELDHA